jgi:multidrug efflux pump subunit AcrA (membrane-fusion protein)
MLKKINRTRAINSDYFRRFYKTITRTLLTYPGRSFFGIIGFFFLLIIAGNIMSKPQTKAAVTAPAAKDVSVFSIGKAPKIRIMGSVETSGVVKITAQSGGVVQQIYAREGTAVSRGSTILWLSTNYQGGTMASVAREIAQKNNEFVTQNYDAQKDLIDRQRQIADTVRTQASDLRTITNNSIDDTQHLVDLDQGIVDTLQGQLAQYEATNSAGANNAFILQTKQGIAGIQMGLNSLKTSLASAKYQSNEDNAPANLADYQHDLAVAQLDLQQKSLDLNRELSGLNLRVAQISESLMFPASPVTGTVERIYVTPGQNVSQGALLATVTGTKRTSRVVVLVSETTAAAISRLEPSTITSEGTSFDVLPTYVSTQPTDGSLYSVTFTVPEEDEHLMNNGSSVAVDLPIGAVAATSAVPFVPLDAVYQTQDASYVYVATGSADGKWTAISKKLTLGNVFGRFVAANAGLAPSDQVILTRNVVDGDLVTFR